MKPFWRSANSLGSGASLHHFWQIILSFNFVAPSHCSCCRKILPLKMTVWYLMCIANMYAKICSRVGKIRKTSSKFALASLQHNQMFLVFAEDFRAQILKNFCGFFQLANRFLRVCLRCISSTIMVVSSRKKAAGGKILRQQLQWF